MKIAYLPLALQDFEAIYEAAYRNWPGQAGEITGRLRAAIDRLARFPLLSALVEPPIESLPGLRFLPLERVGRRVIDYQPLVDRIHIIRILHGSMDYRAALAE